MDLDQCACSGRTLDRLLRPAVLALLAREKTHGYDIVQRLQDLVRCSLRFLPIQAEVYKALKSMEKKGCLCQLGVCRDRSG